MYPSKAIEAASAILFQRRQQAVQEAEARRDALYARVPPLREHHRQLRELAQELAVAGRCQCMEALLRAESCRGLPAAALDGRCTFQSFDLNYYPDTPDQEGRSPRRTMAHILQRCRDYADHFGPGSGSLLFLGRTGLGKTHLSLAIAGQVAAAGAGVLYSSIQAIVDRYERVRFDRGPSSDDREFIHMAPRCDLLVIDDLGSEFSTTFSQSVFYNLLNERITAGLPVILSTNLTLEQLNTTYNERIASRVLCGCTSYSFAGKDIRFLKQAERRK